MAQVYQMPPDTREKEKIIGGLLTMGQLLWILVGVGIYGIFLFTFFSVLKFAALVLGLPLLVIGVPFAFVKKEELPLFRYLVLKREYKKKVKRFVNYGGVSYSTDDELVNGRG